MSLRKGTVWNSGLVNLSFQMPQRGNISVAEMIIEATVPRRGKT